MSSSSVLHQLCSDYDYLFKILILGNSGVGKSSLLIRYTDDCFSETFIATVGVDFKIRTLGLGGKKLKLQMWDTAGQERFRTIVSAFYRNVDGVVIVYDVTDADSFHAVERWLSEVDRFGRGNACKLIVGNKADLKSKRVISHEMGKALADKLNIPFLETSAKQNINVEQCFLAMASELKTNADKNTLAAVQDKARTRLRGGKPVESEKCWC